MKRVLHFFTNRYFLVTAFFVSWIFFFASNDIVTQYRQNVELKEMKTKIKFLESEITKMKNQKESLQKDSASIEKFARENYRMKKQNEEIFIFDTIK